MVTDRQTDRQTDTQNDYCNPAAHAQRVNYYSCMFIAQPSLSVQFQGVFGTRIFERRKTTPRTSKNKDEQRKDRHLQTKE